MRRDSEALWISSAKVSLLRTTITWFLSTQSPSATWREATSPEMAAVTTASSSYAKVLPELLPTPSISAVALCVVEMPPGFVTSMVTSRTMMLPVSTVSTAEILLTAPLSTSKVLSRVTEAVCPT